MRRKKTKSKYESSASILQAAGLRPTRQRRALADWLFDGVAKGCGKHVTAEQVHAAAKKDRVPVSLATVYNTLNQFTDSGLLRQIVVNGGQVYFDTTTMPHHHMYDEDSGCLCDLPSGTVRVAAAKLKLPAGKSLARVDVIVRVHSGE